MATLRLEYIGPSSEGVIVPDLERIVLPGEVVELTTEEEIAVGKSLLEQTDNWQKSKSPSAAKSDDAG